MSLFVCCVILLNIILSFTLSVSLSILLPCLANKRVHTPTSLDKIN